MRVAELRTSLQLLSDEERAHACFELSGLTFESGEYSEALSLSLEARDIYHKFGDRFRYALSLATNAFCYHSLCRMDEAIAEMIKAVMEFQDLEVDEEWEHRNYLAGWFEEIDAWDLARLEYQRCLQQFEVDEVVPGRARIFQYLAFSSCQLGNCSESTDNLYQARMIWQVLNEPMRLAEIDLNLARCFNHQVMGLKAEVSASGALAIFEQSQRKDYRAQAYGELAKAKSHQGEKVAALEFLNRALDLYGTFIDLSFPGIHSLHREKVRVLHALGQHQEADELETRTSIIDRSLRWNGI